MLGPTVAWPNLVRGELLWWGLNCPRSCPHSELVVMEGLQWRGQNVVVKAEPSKAETTKVGRKEI